MDKKFTQDDFLKVATGTDIQNLSPPMRQKFMVDLIRTLEHCWPDRPMRSRLMGAFHTCLAALTAEDFPSEILMRVREKIPVQPEDLQDFLTATLPLERSTSWPLKEEEYLITYRDLPAKKVSDKKEAGEFFLIAENIRSAANTGSLFRSSECFGIEHIYLCGYTATPEKDRIRRTAMGTDHMVSWSWHQRAETVIRQLQARGVTVLALETCPDSTSLFSYTPPESMALLVGNERHGLSRHILSLCDGVLHIPLSGRKNSLNVGVAFGVAAATLRTQSFMKNSAN